jgi:hypothetical protein
VVSLHGPLGFWRENGSTPLPPYPSLIPSK